MTPSYQSGRSAKSPRSTTLLIALVAGVGLVTLGIFACGLWTKSFADEYAYITQSYYADLFFEGKTNDPAWLELPAYDLQPIPKYLIGLALRLARLPVPGPNDARAWYRNYAGFGGPETLLAARLPTIFLAALGCVALCGCGVLLGGRLTGVMAGLLLAASALYRLHAHRAMSDVPCESLLILGLFLGLWSWRRLWSPGGTIAGLLAVLAAGGCCGLAIDCKFNGFLGLLILGLWGLLALAAPGVGLGRRLVVAAGLGLAALPALGTAVAFNPFLTAHPPYSHHEAKTLANLNVFERFRFQFRHRVALSEGQKLSFPHNALHTPLDRMQVFLVQGFGRFGPLGPSNSNSEIRFDWRQDAGALLWTPVVILGLASASRRGWHAATRGAFPGGLALLGYAAASWGVVVSYLPMAWDRYLLPVQAPAVLLGAFGLRALWDRLGSQAARHAIATPPAVQAAAGVFLILLASAAYFWHSRDWNTASRLMLTYSIVDRGTIDITGLEDQTGDRALFQGRYYSDKLPGYPLLAAPVYALVRLILGMPAHPLGPGKALDYWPADYWVTLLTSGVYTALTAALLVVWSCELGCRPTRAALLGLAYGLATPAYLYATLAYGHQATALALFLGLFLLTRKKGPRSRQRWFAAGLLASLACVIELQVAPAAAVLGIVLLVQVGQSRVPWNALGLFGVGAIGPMLVMMAYNLLAFGSPFDMGYFHHAHPEFAGVHSQEHPLGLTWPDGTKVIPLVLGWRRGLLVHAPILFLSVPGWIALLRRGNGELALASLGCSTAVFLVNLSYPEWTGGWSTGPRLLTPLLPFAILPIASLLAGTTPLSHIATWCASLLALLGGFLMLLYQGADGRVPHTIPYPLPQALLPVWIGDSIPPWRYGQRFCRTIVSEALGGISPGQPAWLQSLQFAPLVLLQSLAITGLWRGLSRRAASGPHEKIIEEKQQDRRPAQQPQDHDRQAERPLPDPLP